MESTNFTFSYFYLAKPQKVGYDISKLKYRGEKS